MRFVACFPPTQAQLAAEVFPMSSPHYGSHCQPSMSTSLSAHSSCARLDNDGEGAAAVAGNRSWFRVRALALQACQEGFMVV